MAFKLTKVEAKEGERIAVELEEALSILDKACEVFNNDLKSMRLVVQDAIDGYNDKLSDARQFSEDLATRFEIEIDKKSESLISALQSFQAVNALMEDRACCIRA